MSVIIMNLLVGLTVNKIEELDKAGEKIKAIKRVEDIQCMAKIFRLLEKRFCFNWMPKPIMQRLKQINSTKVKPLIKSHFSIT